MPDTEGYNIILNGTSAYAGVDAFVVGTIPSGAGAGNNIYASIVGLRVNSFPVSSSNALPVSDATVISSLAQINTNTSGIATAAGQTSGNSSLTTIANAQGAQGTGLSPPPGGTGLLGFLSGIYNKVSSALSITGTVTSNDGGTGGTGINQPAGGSGISGWLSGIYTTLVGTILVKPSTKTIVTLDVNTIINAGTAQVVLNAGHITSGGFIHTTNAAGMYVAQIGNAGTVDTGNTVFVPASITYSIIESTGSLSVNSTVSGLTVSGYGLQ